MKDFGLDSILSTFKSRNYQLVVGGYRMNPFGVRASGGATNTFNDVIGMLYQDYGGSWCLEKFIGTTDPGYYWLENPMNVNGSAIVVPGQYLNSHAIGLHHGEYEALVQVGKVSVYRDKDKDDIYDIDPSTMQSGLFGINIHRANAKQTSTQVGQWSAGCQVIANPNPDFVRFIELCNKHIQGQWGKFNYTLFLEEELNA